MLQEILSRITLVHQLNKRKHRINRQTDLSHFISYLLRSKASKVSKASKRHSSTTILPLIKKTPVPTIFTLHHHGQALAKDHKV
jgi:RNA:NAD 2'-phosphotransferase (TPT1/KptA family)